MFAFFCLKMYLYYIENHMKKYTLTEEINRIKMINKVISEQGYDDSYNSFGDSGRYGYDSYGGQINPNTDYLSDIGAQKIKIKPPKSNAGPGNQKGGRKARELDINSQTDRHTIIKALLRGYRVKKATPETLERIRYVLGNNTYYDMIDLRLSQDHVFDIEFMYYLLKDGLFKPPKDLLDSKEFMNKVMPSKNMSTVYNRETNSHSEQQLSYRFKSSTIPTIDEFTKFIQKRHKKYLTNLYAKFEKENKLRNH